MTIDDRFAWVEMDENADAPLCLTVVQGRTEDEVLDALRADRASRHVTTFEQCFAEATDDRRLVQVWSANDRVLVLEPNGWSLSIEDALLTVAGKVAAVTAYFGATATMAVVVARKGAVVRQFDPLFRDEEEGDGDILPEEAGLAFGENTARASSLALVAKLTGFAATRDEILDAQRPTYALRP